MAMEFQVVERSATAEDVKDEFVKALIETKDSGKAVQLVLPENTNFTNWQSTLRNRLKKHDLRLRISWNKAKRTATCYTEPLA